MQRVFLLSVYLSFHNPETQTWFSIASSTSGRSEGQGGLTYTLFLASESGSAYYKTKLVSRRDKFWLIQTPRYGFCFLFVS